MTRLWFRSLLTKIRIKNFWRWEISGYIVAQNFTKPAMALVSVNWHRFVRQKVHSLEHTSACHGGHVPWHILPCTHYILAWGLKHPGTLSLLLPGSPDLCTVSPLHRSIWVVKAGIYTGTSPPKTAAPKKHVKSFEGLKSATHCSMLKHVDLLVYLEK